MNRAPKIFRHILASPTTKVKRVQPWSGDNRGQYYYIHLEWPLLGLVWVSALLLLLPYSMHYSRSSSACVPFSGDSSNLTFENESSYSDNWIHFSSSHVWWTLVICDYIVITLSIIKNHNSLKCQIGRWDESKTCSLPIQIYFIIPFRFKVSSNLTYESKVKHVDRNYANSSTPFCCENKFYLWVHILHYIHTR